jgi:hypothetical protein
MNTPPPHAEAPDELDRLFSEFFKAQLKHPWPNAPVPASSSASTQPTEPSELRAARAQEAPRNTPAPARRDSSARARFTLAASVALMLGTCWYLSNGFAPGSRPGQGTPNPATPMLPDSGADADKHPPLKTLEEDKAKGNVGGTKMDLDKFE